MIVADDRVQDEELTRLNSALARTREHTIELEDTRKAMLFLLEDLEANRQRIEQAKQEWTAVFDAIRDPVMLHDREFRVVLYFDVERLSDWIRFDQLRALTQLQQWKSVCSRNCSAIVR